MKYQYTYTLERGFTLIELMLATSIIIIALCGLLAAFTSLFSINEHSRNATLSITSCQDKMEEIRNSNFDTIFATYNGASFNIAGIPADQGRGSVFIDDTNPNLLLVYVSASWRERSNRIIGEDTNLNGVLNVGEDLNLDNRLNSPAQIVTLMARR